MESWNTVTVDREALRRNFMTVTARAGKGTGVVAVVKADGYGHGLVESARAFAEAGARHFGVAEVGEALALHSAGIQGEVFVLLGIRPAEAEAVVAHDLIPMVYDHEIPHFLEKAAAKAGREIVVHLKVDVGMGRLGVLPTEAEELAARILRLRHVRLDGVAAHLPVADTGDEAANLELWYRFQDILERLNTLAGRRLKAHIANSAALFRFGSFDSDLVRPGIALYGHPPAESPTFAGLGLAPAMRVTTRVAQVKTVPAGFGISYGHTFVTSRPTRIAVLPMGYDDGFLRAVGNRGQVLVRGRRARVVGTVCMNACMVDISDIDGVKAGDEVVVLGRQGEEEITAWEIGRWMETISYEVLCLLGSRNQREYVG